MRRICRLGAVLGLLALAFGVGQAGGVVAAGTSTDTVSLASAQQSLIDWP
ncbi:hypothetical protein [Streptomyces sp. NPDC127092]